MSAQPLPGGADPLIFGVLNTTPDSFSDGGEYLDPAQAIARAEQLVAAGADVVDVGGESTRPGATPVPRDEELARVLPVIRALTAAGITVSIDTIHAATAEAAVSRPAHGSSTMLRRTARPRDARGRRCREQLHTASGSLPATGAGSQIRPTSNSDYE